jgi:hypothetical protein
MIGLNINQANHFLENKGVLKLQISDSKFKKEIDQV